jgi:hypothetical protein
MSLLMTGQLLPLSLTLSMLDQLNSWGQPSSMWNLTISQSEEL